MRLSHRRPFFVALILVMFFVALGCKDKKGAMPKTADERVAQFASKAPLETETFFVIPDVDSFRTKLANLKERLAESGLVGSLQKSLQQAFGVDILDAESWKAAGLTPKSSMSVIVYRTRPVLFMYVDNRQAFEKVLIERAKESFGVEAVTKQETVGKHKVKVLSDDPVRQIAWVYDGKLAIVVMPVLDAEASLDDGTASLVATNVLDTTAEKSLSTSPQFQKYRKNIGNKGAFSMFQNVKPLVSGKDVQDRIKEDPNAEQAVAFIEKNIDYFASYGDMDGDRVTARFLIGGKESFNAVAQEIAKIDTSGKWDGFVTDKTALGIRLSIDPTKALTFALTAMTEDEQRKFKRNLKRSGEAYGLDLEEDLIKQLTGHVGVFFYGIAGNPMMALQAARDPSALASKLGLVAVFRFKNKEAVDKILAKLLETSGGADAPPEMKITVAPLTVKGEELNDFKSLMLPIPNMPVRLFTHNDTLLISTTAFGDEAIHGYLSGTRKKDKRIGDVAEMDLGKEFANVNQFTGIYANAERMSENPGQLLAMVGAGSLVDVFQEAQLKGGADATGAYIELIADLDKPEPKPAGGDTKPADKKEEEAPAEKK